MKNEKFLIYGKHAVFSALNNPKRKIDELLLIKENFEIKKSISLLINKHKRKIKIKYIDNRTIDNIFHHNVKHQGIVASSYKLNIKNYLKIFEKNNNFKYGVILDSITDPNNIGAIYRSASAFGINFIINTHKNSVFENGAILNSACGAFENVETYSTKNISNTLKNFASKNWWTIGLDHDASTNINSTLNKMKESDKLIFVFGSEGKGIRRLIKKNCNFISSIPNMPNTKSINVSNAAAIVFYENYRVKNNKVSSQ